MSDASPPGPRGLALLRLARTFRNAPLAALHELAGYGDLVYFRFAWRHAYFVNWPDGIRDVLVTHADRHLKGLGLQRSKQLLGEGLVTSEGELHHRERRLIQPAFAKARLTAYGRIMADLALAARERWRDGEIVDMAREMMHLTMAIAAKTLFDAEVGSEADEVGRSLATIVAMFDPNPPFWVRLAEQMPYSPRRRRFDAARERLDTVIYRMIAERRADPGDHDDLLARLLAAHDEQGKMSDAQLRDELMTLFLAGHETTASALSWALHLLSIHPEAMARLAAEVDEVLAGAAPTPEDLPRLPYTEGVFSEALRLYPPAFLLGRIVERGYELGGHEIPAGSVVFLSQHVMHRDPRFWPDPERFDPDRWRPEQKAERPRYAYFPFGAGLRQCMGDQFAWLEGTLVLAAIAQRWQVHAVAGSKVAPRAQFLLRPRNGVPLRLELRKTAKVLEEKQPTR